MNCSNFNGTDHIKLRNYIIFDSKLCSSYGITIYPSLNKIKIHICLMFNTFKQCTFQRIIYKKILLHKN
jgi:hypothetical protein